jgi:hypothetical protein
MNQPDNGPIFALFLPEPQKADIGDVHYANPRELSDLGRTEVPQYRYSVDENTMKVNVHFTIRVLTSAIIYTEQFEKDNPGRKKHIEIHELQHYNMFKEAMSNTIILEFEAHEYKGTIDEIASSYLREAANGLQAVAQRDRISQAEFDKKFITIQQNVNKLIDLTVHCLSEVYNAKYPITATDDKQEDEAVRRTTDAYVKMNKTEPVGDIKLLNHPLT